MGSSNSEVGKSCLVEKERKPSCSLEELEGIINPSSVEIALTKRLSIAIKLEEDTSQRGSLEMGYKSHVKIRSVSRRNSHKVLASSKLCD